MILFSFVLFFTFFVIYQYDSDIAAVESGSFGADYQVDEILFKYENDKAEIMFYRATDGSIVESQVKKINIFGKTKYTNSNSSSSIVYAPEWTNIGSTLKYRIYRYESDINYEDFGKYETRVYKLAFYYPLANEHSTSYIAIIDKSNNGTAHFADEIV